MLSLAQLALSLSVSRTLIFGPDDVLSMSRVQRDVLGCALAVTAAGVAGGTYAFLARRAASVALVTLSARESRTPLLRIVPLSFPALSRMRPVDSFSPLALLHTRQSARLAYPPHWLLVSRPDASAPGHALGFGLRGVRRRRGDVVVLDSRGDMGRLGDVLGVRRKREEMGVKEEGKKKRWI